MVMNSTTISRVSAGVPKGGQFAGTGHAEAGIDLAAATTADHPCSECQQPTKRRSGKCRKCDPAARRSNDSTTGPGRPAARSGVRTDRRTGPDLDTDQPSLTLDEIGTCAYGFVPVYRHGAVIDGSHRGCKNAVKLPATHCHKHGGSTETSLGRTVAKAQAEAGRGQCYPLAAEHWDGSDQRLEAAQGQLLRILDTDTSDMADALVRWRAQRGTTPDRFSVGNQLLVLVQHYGDAARAGADSDDAWSKAVELASEPHFTKSKWAELGRDINDDGEGVAVVWWQPGGAPTPVREDGETDAELDERTKTGSGFRGRHGAHIQYPLSATNGDPYEVAPSPMDDRPSGYGDPEPAIDAMQRLATDMGIKVKLTDAKPAGGAYGYWRASSSEIVVWSGVAGGDKRAVAHVLAHELGHARLGHSTDAAAETRTPEKEVAAESFAALVCAHHGIDASRNSAFYVDEWRKGAGIDMTAAGTGPLRSAVEAFDEYVTATA